MSKIYALVSFNETKALSTDRANLEILRDAYCVRDPVTPEDFEIIEYDDFSDTSYVKTLPKPLWSTELNEEYPILMMCKVGLDCELALIKQYNSSDPLTGLMTYHGIVAGSGGCDDSFVHNNNFYCRTDNKFEATSKYMEFMKGKANEQTSEKEN